MTEQAFVDGTFTAPEARRERLTAAVLDHVSKNDAVRLLDLGCGNGLQLLDLAAALPHAHFLGVDTSAANIEAGRELVAMSPHATRLRLVTSNYLALEGERFDVILSDSVLQNIDTPDARLYAKIANDLQPGGLLIVSMPFACLFNRMLWFSRRILRMLRGPRVEGWALKLARRLHPEWDQALLEERIPYLYMLPHRVEGKALDRRLAGQHGLVRIATHQLSHDSPAQPKHRLSVYRKSRRS